jgi:ABC-type spermidine/putrescine transport system permease subunit I
VAGSPADQTPDLERGSVGRRSRKQWSPVLSGWHGLLLCLPLLLMLGGFVVYPLIKLGIDSVTTGEGLGNYGEALSSSAIRKALMTTLLASLAATAVTVTAAGLLAWHIHTARRPLVRAVLWLAVLAPFWMGTVIKNYSFLMILSRDGVVNDFLGLFGLGPVSILYTTTVVILGISYSMIPYAVFALFGVLR